MASLLKRTYLLSELNTFTPWYPRVADTGRVKTEGNPGSKFSPRRAPWFNTLIALLAGLGVEIKIFICAKQATISIA